jgi:hypothetical protein
LQTIELENQAPNIANKEEKAYGSPKHHKQLQVQQTRFKTHNMTAKEG